MVQYPRYHGHFNYAQNAPVTYVPAIYPDNANRRQPRMGTKARPTSTATNVPAYVVPQPVYQM